MRQITYSEVRQAKIKDLKRRIEFEKSQIELYEREIEELEEEERKVT